MTVNKLYNKVVHMRVLTLAKEHITEEEFSHERKTRLGLDGPLVWYYCPCWFVEKGIGAAEANLM